MDMIREKHKSEWIHLNDMITKSRELNVSIESLNVLKCTHLV